MTICDDHFFEGRGNHKTVKQRLFEVASDRKGWPELLGLTKQRKVGVANGMRLAPKAVKTARAKWSFFASTFAMFLLHSCLRQA